MINTHHTSGKACFKNHYQAEFFPKKGCGSIGSSEADGMRNLDTAGIEP